MSVFNILTASQQDQDCASCVPWSRDDSRKATDQADYDRELELQDLVSNIVADSPDSCFNEGLLPSLNSIWSPNREDRQRHQLDATTQQYHPFPPNYTSQDGVSRAQRKSADRDVGGLHHRLDGTQQWLFSGPHGDVHSSSASIPSRENLFWSQQSKHKDDDNEPMSNIQYFREVFRSPDEPNSSCFDPFYEDRCVQSNNLSEDVDSLMLSLQSLMRPDGAPHLDAVAHRQTAALNHNTNQQWKSSFLTKHVPKPLLGEMKSATWKDRGDGGGPRRPGFQSAPEFSSENSSFYQQPRPGVSRGNSSSRSQKKMAVFSEDVGATGLVKQHAQLSAMQSHVKPRPQKKRQNVCVAGSSRIRVQTHTPMKAAVNVDLQGAVQLWKGHGQSVAPPSGNSQLCMPAVCPADSPRRPPRMRFNHKYNGVPRGGGASALPAGDMMAEISALVTRGGLARQLDQVYEQWRCLKVEINRAESFSMNWFKLRRTRSSSPPPAGIHQLIDYQKTEHTKVVELMKNMESIHVPVLNHSSWAALSRHSLAISVLQERHNMTQQQQSRSLLLDDAMKELLRSIQQLRTALWALQMTRPFPDHHGEEPASTPPPPRSSCSF